LEGSEIAPISVSLHSLMPSLNYYIKQLQTAVLWHKHM